MTRRPVAEFVSSLCLLLFAGCSPGPPSFTLLDSETGHPVAGALVYAEEELTVFRSDVHGAVELPAGWGEAGVTVWAKNHQPLQAALADLSGAVTLTFDPSLVNPREAEMVFERADSLRGTYGPYRENNELLWYGLNVRVDPEAGYIEGENEIRLRMLAPADRIQLDLFEHLAVDSILYEGDPLSFERDGKVVWVEFSEVLEEGEEPALHFHYSGYPESSGRFGGISFEEDSLGNGWVFTANQGLGASVWWPNKDQQPDEPDSMTIAVTVPTGYVDVSNGRLMSVEEGDDGTTRFHWKVHYPINNYSVSLNIAKYTHFSDTLGDLSLDYYVLPYDLERARSQFSQVKPMLQCFNEKLGPYPFPRDGYKLIQVPYSGMEHQSAVTYGNGWENGYLGRDWTGVGISPRFDFIIIHESAHEWYGNSVTANDVSDAWIHEGWGTWLEGVYVECLWGYDDALTYLNGYQEKIRNQEPIIGPTGVNHWPTGDQYFKGALFLNTLRHVIDDETTWWNLIREYTAHFAYQNIWTTDVINFFNTRLNRDLRPLFHQYLYYWNLPVLEIREEGDAVAFRWDAEVEDFDMPVKVRVGQEIRTIHPTKEWTSEPLNGAAPEDWQPATDLFYIEVRRHRGGN